MSRKALLSLLCAAALLLPLVCGCSSGNTPAATSSAVPAAAVAETTQDTSFRASYLPERRFDGYKYRIVSYEEYPSVIDEPTGSIVNDSIYERNLKIKEKYDVTFEAIEYPYNQYTDVTELMKNSALAQSDDFDLCLLVFKAAYESVLNGYALKADSVPYADLTQPWYYQTINDKLTFSGIPLLGVNAFDKNPGGKCLIFNLNIVSDLDLTSPYSLVDSGAWTYDKMYEMMNAAALDKDGDGQMTDKDRFGLIGEPDTSTMLLFAGSGLTLVKEADGALKVSQDEALIDLLLKFLRNTEKDGTLFDSFVTYGWEENSRLKGNEFFKSGGALFRVRDTDTLTQFGDMEDDYGILPYPKVNPEQAEYYVPFTGALIGMVPTASADAERAGIIREALAVESLNICHPAYYENSLQARYVRDRDSIRMLEIISSHQVLDLGCSIWWDSVRAPWMECVQTRSENIASAIAGGLPKSEKAIQDLMDLIDAYLSSAKK